MHNITCNSTLFPLSPALNGTHNMQLYLNKRKLIFKSLLCTYSVLAYLNIVPTWWRSIINVDCSAVINLLPIAQNILFTEDITILLSTIIFSCNKINSKRLDNQEINLSVKPTVAASAGTKLPMWERKTINAT